MTTTTFNPNVFLTPASSQRFLNPDQEIAEIIHSSPSSSHHGRLLDADSFNTSELYYLFRGFLLTVASYLLHGACFTRLSKKMWVMSRHAIDDGTAIKTQKIFQNHLLSRSVNTHRQDTEDFYLQPPLRTSHVTYPDRTHMNFFL